jgi:hypothetical protein
MGVRLLAGGVAMVALVACPGPTPTPEPTTTTTTTTLPPAPGTVFAESFAAGTIGSEWESQGAVVQTGAGDPAAWVDLPAAGLPTFISLPPRVLAPDHVRYSFTGRFRVVARTAGQTVGLATVENSLKSQNDDLFVDARTGRCRVDVYRDDTAMSPGRCDDGQWHQVTMQGDYGASTYTLSWTLDGVAMPGVQSVGLTLTTVHRLYLGDATSGKTNVSDWTAIGFTLG